jgi:predicted RNA-binding Zn-ribbon protein involved in translation (DUF1610 family)
MKLIRYEIDGVTTLAAFRYCLQCDKATILEIRHLRFGELYYCPHCGLDWRLFGPEIQCLGQEVTVAKIHELFIYNS